MCGRYDFGKGATDEKMAALINAMERRYPGMYKTGDPSRRYRPGRDRAQ